MESPTGETPLVHVYNIGRIDYKEAWELQTAIHKDLIDNKLKRKERAQHALLVCEHNPVFTLGKSGSKEHLLLDTDKNDEFSFYKINRGGDITYHGPGQLTVYPIFDMDSFFHDVHRYVRSLEEVVIRTLSNFGIESERKKDFTGVWIPADQFGIQKKICAIGVHMSRWVTLHGLALNVSNDLSHFNHIIPCGIADPNKTVTNMENETEVAFTAAEVTDFMVDTFAEVFHFKKNMADKTKLLEWFYTT